MRFLLKSTGFFVLASKAGGLPVPRNCHEPGPARPRHPFQPVRPGRSSPPIADTAGLYKHYLLILAAIAPIASFIGMSLVGVGLRCGYPRAHSFGAGVGHRVPCHLAGHGVRAGAHRRCAGPQLRRGEEPDPGAQGGGLFDDGGFRGRRAQPAALAVHPGGCWPACTASTCSIPGCRC